jgi:mRNA-degrading endonuclease toxin of MazEF toxin-antitoxin module
MRYKQKDIVEINFMLPNFQFKPHLAIIVSNDELNEKEDFFYLVLISSKNYFPEYSYPLSDEMITCKLTKKSYIKCQILTFDKENGVIRKVGKMREPYFSEMVNKIITSIF